MILTRTEVGNIDGVTVLRHPAQAKGIVYLNVYFSLAELTLEELPVMTLLTNLLGKLSTRQRDAQTQPFCRARRKK